MANCTGRFVSGGRAKLAQLIQNTDYPPEIYIAWGTGTATISNTDTGLGFEVARARGTITRVDADTYTIYKSFQAQDDGTFSEMGLFDAAVGGTMLYRGGYSTDSPVGVYDVESKDISSGDLLNITIGVNIKATNLSITTVGMTKCADYLSEKPVV